MKKIKSIISIAFIAAALFTGCQQSSGGDQSSSIRSMENLKDVIKAGEDLSGTWDISEMYLKMYSKEDGYVTENFESNDLDEIVKYLAENNKDKNKYSDEPDDVDISVPEEDIKFDTKEEAAEYFMNNITESETAQKTEKQEWDQGILMMQAFGGTISQSNYSNNLYIKINEDRTQIIYQKSVNGLLKGSFMGKNFDDEAQVTVKYVLTRQ